MSWCDNTCSLPQCGSDRGARPGPFWLERGHGQETMQFLSFLLKEQWQRTMGKQRTRVRDGFFALSAPSQAKSCASTRQGYVDDVAGKVVWDAHGRG